MAVIPQEWCCSISPNRRVFCSDRNQICEQRQTKEFLAKAAQKAFAFNRMCKGWAMGSKEFKGALVEEHKEALKNLVMTGNDFAEIRERAGEDILPACLERLGRTSAETVKEPKAALWKVAIAAHLRAISTVKNTWLAEKLHMGDPDGVSRYVSELRQGKRPEAVKLLRRITDISHLPAKSCAKRARFKSEARISKSETSSKVPIFNVSGFEFRISNFPASSWFRLRRVGK